ncbi:MAG: hypothetical protein Q9M37_07315 [Desulfonauticus sp.]|nr:hypothetical protein [Desulfonauticus sp.]
MKRLKCIFLILFMLIFSNTILQAKEKNFSSWLYNLGAYEIFLQQHPEPTTFAEVLPFLTACYNLKRFQAIEKFFQTKSSYLDQLPVEQKIQAYLILARSFRTEQKYFLAIKSYSQLASFLPLKRVQNILKQEKNIHLLFKCACLNQYWSKLQFDKQTWKNILNLCLTLYPKDNLFTFLKQNILSAKNIFTKQNNFLFLKICLAQYLQLNNLSKQFYLQLEDKKIKKIIYDLFFNTKNNKHKSTIFYALFNQDIQKFNKDKFQTNNLKLIDFLKRLNNYRPNKGLLLIKNQLNSIFIDQSTLADLNKIYFCFLIFNDQYEQAKEILSHLEINSSKLFLAKIFLEKNIPNLDKEKVTYSKRFFKYILHLAGIFISGNFSPLDQQKFSPIGFYKKLISDYKKDPNSFVSNYKLSFLFPKTSFSQQAHLFLAQQAYSKGHKKLAWAYLQRVQPDLLNLKQKINFLKARAGILMDLNQPEQALQTYLELLSLNITPDQLGLSPVKIVKLGLLAQRLGKFALAENIFTNLLNFKQQNLTNALKAEAMFWLAETYQFEGKDKQAIEKYLEITYYYPEEHIWAITACYRAAQLSEKHGHLDMAKKLYTLVLKNADRKSQKQAAKQRLQAIEATRQQSDIYWLY